MKVALTAATGFIGSHVLTELREHGHEVTTRLGDTFAEVLLLDQGTNAARARAELGWSASHPSPVDEFRHGSYRK
jgi:thioester reductase-like protein